MSEEKEISKGKHGERPASPPTPFDHPLFLPVLLIAGAIWFGYDGWLTADPDMVEHQTFNRWGFAVLALLASWFGYRGWREFQQQRAKQTQDQKDEPPASP